MRLLAVAAFLAVSAPAAADAYKMADYLSANTRLEFHQRMIVRDADPAAVEAAGAEYLDCMVREYDGAMPAEFNAAVDRFIATKARDDWDRLIELNGTIFTDQAEDLITGILKTCARYKRN